MLGILVLRAIALALLAAGAAGCDTGPSTLTAEEWHDQVRMSRTCDTAADCTLIAAPCGCCDVAVNVDNAERLQELAESVDCVEVCSCIASTGVDCPSGVCRGLYE